MPAAHAESACKAGQYEQHYWWYAKNVKCQIELNISLVRLRVRQLISETSCAALLVGSNRLVNALICNAVLAAMKFLNYSPSDYWHTIGRYSNSTHTLL